MKIIVAKPNEEATITYGLHKTPFGTCFIATTEKGICALAFVNKKESNSFLNTLKKQWKKAKFLYSQSDTKKLIDKIFGKGSSKADFVIHVPSTDFQIATWRSLLKIPKGKTITYKELAQKVGSPKAVRAVGTAVGSNLVAYIIPCHRVVRSDRSLGGYRWGEKQKQLLLEAEKY